MAGALLKIYVTGNKMGEKAQAAGSSLGRPKQVTNYACPRYCGQLCIL